MANILFIANTVDMYGANRSMLDLAVGLQKLGQSIFFFIPQQGTGEKRHRLRKVLDSCRFQYAFVRYWPSVHSSNEKGINGKILRMEMNKVCLLEMKNYAVKWGIDLIHTNSLTHLIGALLSKKLNIPHVWHIREALKKDYDLIYDSRAVYRYHLKRAEQIICISDYVRNTHKKILWGASTITIYNGLDISKYIIDNAYESKPIVYKLIICGVIEEAKGQLEAVKAMECLINDYKINKIHLQIVGEGSGDYYKQLVRYIKHHKLHKYISILPFHEDLRELRRNADIALVCSRSEAFGRVTVESMLSENLVIGVDFAGTAELVKDGITGYLYKMGDTEALCKKLYYAITHWKEQEHIIRKAKKYACSNFDVNCYAEKILNIYNHLL